MLQQVSPRHLGTTACKLTNPFSFIAEQYAWFCGPLHRYQTLGPGNQGKVGVTWLLLHINNLSFVSNHTSMADQPFSDEAWGDVEKPRQDMVFLLVVSSITLECEWVFGLMVVWAHPHQAHFETLEDAAHKLVLLPDVSADWPYTFEWLNNTISYEPLTNKGHISTMTDSVPSMDAHGWLHQLQIWKLLQHKGKVLCPEGLNREVEALQFTFPELPLWDVTMPSKPFWEPLFLEVDLCSTQPEGVTPTTEAPTTILVLTYSLTDTIEPPCYLAKAINLHLQGALEWLQWASSTASTPVSKNSMPRRELPSAAPRAHPQQKEQKVPSVKKEIDSAIPVMTGTLTQTPQWVATPDDTPSFTHTVHQLLWLYHRHWKWQARPLSHSPRPP